MQYIEQIIQEELKKRVNEGLFGWTRGDKEDQKVAKAKRAHDSLEKLRKAMMNVCGNLLNYGQTVQDYSSVRVSMELEKVLNQQLAKLGNTITTMSQMESEGLMTDDEVGQQQMTPPSEQSQTQQQQQGTGQKYQYVSTRGANFATQPDVEQQQPIPTDSMEEQPHGQYFEQGDPINGPSDAQVAEETWEYLKLPKARMNNSGKVSSWFEGGEMEYVEGKTFYRILPDEDNPDVGYFELIDNQTVRDFVTEDPQSFLSPCCKYTYRSNAREISTVKRGKAEYRNNKWFVVEKATLEFS